ELTGRERSRIEALIRGDEKLLTKLAGQLKPANRRGVLFIGPSGAGKTSLINAATNRVDINTPTTVSIDTTFVNLCGSVVALRDTPGTAQQGGRELWSAIKRLLPS